MGSVESTPQGGIRVPSRPTRVGVFAYRTPDGATRREYRPPEEVFSPASLATLAAAPVTDLHPANPVDPTNWKTLAVGHVGEDVHQDGDHVAASLLIQDQGAIGKVQAGERCELSAGYTCDLESSPGVTPQGEEFDAIQRTIRYNHVAMGPTGWGRQGPSVAMRLDSGDAFEVPAIEQKEDAVEKEMISGREYQVGSPEHVAALRGQRDTERGRADAAERAAKTPATPDPKAVHSLAKARADLLVTAHRVAAQKGVRLDAVAVEAATNDQLAAQLISMIDPEFPLEGKTPDYLAGALTMMVRGMIQEEGTETVDAAKKAQEPPAGPGNAPGTEPAQNPPMKTDAAQKATIFQARAGQAAPESATHQDAQDRHDPEKARLDAKKTNAERWKNPLAATKTPAR